MKIIFIIPFSPKYDYLSNPADELEGAIHSWENDKGQRVCVYNGDWGVVIAERWLKINSRLNIEVWRPDIRADKIYSYTFKSGLAYKSFPVNMQSFYHGIKKNKRVYAPEMENVLMSYYQKDQNLILLLSAERTVFSVKLTDNFKSIIPILYYHFTHNSTLCPRMELCLNPVKLLHRWVILLQMRQMLRQMEYLTVAHVEGSQSIGRKFNIKTAMFTPGFDPDDYTTERTRNQVRKEKAIAENRKILFSSSRLVPEKQIDKIIMTLKDFKDEDFHYFISGHGPLDYQQYLLQLVDELELSDKISFIGFVSKSELIDYYLITDLFLMTSIKEAGPGSTNMAVLYDIPIFSTRTGSTAEILEENNAGLLVDSANYSEWTASLTQFFKGKEIKKLPKDILIERKGAWKNIEKLDKLVKEIYQRKYQNEYAK